ncbi:hypothetical protein [Ponticaulis sp.]|uniref:hypothetical protein n=1 Tax=Ponticaulis sp. TaxID=2020902 RepID=UPI002637D5A9|nr:hypothetical protein [Ponticaulis sp.]MDF1681900.1 hypothetical protein [Ponticaulis sp.]
MRKVVLDQFEFDRVESEEYLIVQVADKRGQRPQFGSLSEFCEALRTDCEDRQTIEQIVNAIDVPINFGENKYFTWVTENLERSQILRDFQRWKAKDWKMYKVYNDWNWRFYIFESREYYLAYEWSTSA